MRLGVEEPLVARGGAAHGAVRDVLVQRGELVLGRVVHGAQPCLRALTQRVGLARPHAEIVAAIESLGELNRISLKNRNYPGL